MSVAPHLHLPPPDRLLSSRTGWTRAHWEATADRMLDALVPYATPGFAQYRLPGRGSWSGVVSTVSKASPGRSCLPPAGSRGRAGRPTPR